MSCDDGYIIDFKNDNLIIIIITQLSLSHVYKLLLIISRTISILFTLNRIQSQNLTRFFDSLIYLRCIQHTENPENRWKRNLFYFSYQFLRHCVLSDDFNNITLTARLMLHYCISTQFIQLNLFQNNKLLVYTVTKRLPIRVPGCNLSKSIRNLVI